MNHLMLGGFSKLIIIITQLKSELISVQLAVIFAHSHRQRRDHTRMYGLIKLNHYNILFPTPTWVLVVELV